MSSRIKYLIGKKILSNENHIPLRIANAMNIIGENGMNPSVYIDLKEKCYSDNEFKEVIESLKYNNNTFFKIVNTEENICTRVQVEKNYFLKNILEEIVVGTTTVQTNSKKIIIDFSSPNVAKPFHVGHLRSTIIGNYIANINTHFKNDVTKINYLGDWGTQFGLLQIGLRELNINKDKLKTDPINILYSAYVHANKMAENNDQIMDEARKYFSDVEQGKSDLTEWKEICQVTVDELTSTYRRLGVHFDIYNWESSYNAQAINNVINTLSDKNILRTDNLGRKVTTVKNRDIVLMKSDNSTLYISRDVAALLDRYQRYNFDKMLYVVDNSQTDHFVALFEIAEKLDSNFALKCEHIKFGRVKGMSSRKGNVVFLKDILNEARDKMHEQQLRSPNTRRSSLDDNTCDVLGVTAVLINDLKQSRLKDYTFDWKKALQTDGDSGIKLQYLHCRLWSIERNCGHTVPSVCIPQILDEPFVLELVVELAKFEDVLQRSLEDMEACYLVNYLFKLSRHVNKCVKYLRVMNEKEDVARQRLLLFHASRLVIRRGLELLGVKPLNEM